LNKKTKVAALALIMALTINGTALAAPTTPLQEKQQIGQDIEKLDTQISTVMSEVEENKAEIAQIQTEIKKVESEVKASEKKLLEQQGLYNDRLRAMYMSGSNSYIGVLLEADGLDDLISKVEAVKTVITYDQRVMGELNAAKAELDNKKGNLQANNDKVVATKAENQEKLTALNNDKKDLDKKLASLKTYANVPDGTSKTVATAVTAVTTIRATATTYEPSRGSASVSSSAIVAYASNFIGTPYAWGGNGPSTFDCSGFTSYVFRHFGVSLPRTASGQQGTGASVAKADLQPGDLVFFGSPAHHVGIYVGNGCYIHAPRTGDVVKISSLGSRSDYSGARRVY
jgi:cell wall-associated NlpC family hydrolase